MSRIAFLSLRALQLALSIASIGLSAYGTLTISMMGFRQGSN